MVRRRAISEDEIDLIFKGVVKCDDCILTKKNYKCPKMQYGEFCHYLVEKLGKIKGWDDLQKEIVLTLGEMLLLLAVHTQVKASIGLADFREITSVSSSLSKYITATKGTLDFRKKKSLAGLLSGES